MALKLCRKCRKKILSKAVRCPYCGCTFEQHGEELICKINDVDYDFTEIYQRLMAIDKSNPEWRHTDEMLEIIWEMYDLTEIRGTTSFCVNVAETGVLPSEYNAMTVEEWQKQIKKSSQSKIVVRCPYCGSYDTKKIFFLGGYAQKQWHCKNCQSDF